MIQVLPVSPRIVKKANKLGVKRKLDKAVELFKKNWRHPGLKTELLEPKKMAIWSFRVDKKVRAIFIWREDRQAIEILNITVHYH